MKTKLLFSFLVLSSLSFGQTLCTSGLAGVYPCNNVDLLSNLNFTQLGGLTSARGNDCWGWTDPLTNKEYAIMGCTSHTAFVDVTNPAVPIYLGKVVSHNSVNSTWRDIKVYNNFAFIVSEAAGHGMQVFDLKRLRNVTTPQTFLPDTRYGGFGNCHNIAINEATGFAYCVGTGTASGGPHIVNIQDPLNPVFVLGYGNQGYSHDAQIVNYAGPDVAHIGKELYFGSNENRVVIIDVTNKTTPILLASFTYANTSYTHQGWLTEDHKYFIVGDELDESNFGFNTRSIVIDVTDIDNPVLNFNYSGTTAAIDHNGYTKGNLFHLASYRAGYRVIDMAAIQTGQMTEVAYFDTYPASNNANFNGAWSVYPYFASGTVLISDIERGLFMVRPNASLDINTVSQSQFSMVPNPARDNVTISSKIGIRKIQLYDVSGKVIYQTQCNELETETIDVAALQKGLYFVKLNDTATKKLIIQ